jgi:hypothetical protein
MTTSLLSKFPREVSVEAVLGATGWLQSVYQQPFALRPLPRPEPATIRRRNSERSDKTTDLLPHISQSGTHERTTKNHWLSRSVGSNLHHTQALAAPDGHFCTLGLDPSKRVAMANLCFPT